MFFLFSNIYLNFILLIKLLAHPFLRQDHTDRHDENDSLAGVIKSPKIEKKKIICFWQRNESYLIAFLIFHLILLMRNPTALHILKIRF